MMHVFTVRRVVQQAQLYGPISDEASKVIQLTLK